MRDQVRARRPDSCFAAHRPQAVAGFKRFTFTRRGFNPIPVPAALPGRVHFRRMELRLVLAGECSLEHNRTLGNSSDLPVVTAAGFSVRTGIIALRVRCWRGCLFGYGFVSSGNHLPRKVSRETVDLHVYADGAKLPLQFDGIISPTVTNCVLQSKPKKVWVVFGSHEKTPQGCVSTTLRSRT